uniref:C2H2-type domain-containing protein n=1 Tax=Myripristis murdjan TaxID=586833 RepID=A0A667XNT5_9TELE
MQRLRARVHERITAAAEELLPRIAEGRGAAGAPELRALLTERLAAAAQDISGLLEGAAAEYEEKADRSEQEMSRQRKLLRTVLNPEVKLHRAVLPLNDQQLSVKKEESNLEQEEPEPPHIKEEKEELWTSQEAEQLQGLQEADITEFPVKSEDDEGRAQTSQLHQGQTEESREAEQMETESDGEESARNLDPAADLQPARDDQLLSSHSPEPETEDSEEDWKETGDPQSDSTPLSELLFSQEKFDIDEALSSCCVTTPAGEKLWRCSVCGKSFKHKGNFKRHMRLHTGEKPFSCSVCAKSFICKGNLKQHMTNHTGEKPLSCSVCSKSFMHRGKFNRHMMIHSGEKPFSCSVCNRGFSEVGHMRRHMRIHSKEKPFGCKVCGQRFKHCQPVFKHMKLHAGEEPRNGDVCNI